MKNLNQFSLFEKPVTNTMPARVVNIIDVYNYVKGTCALDQTRGLRAITEAGPHRDFKAKNFDFVTFSGKFSTRKSDGLIEHSGFLCLDFDHVEDPDKLKEQLLSNEYFVTELLFTSPSGNGVKWVIRVDLDGLKHSDVFRAVTNCLGKTTDLPEPDKSGKDVTRTCFLPHDEHVYINPEYLGQDETAPKKKFDAKEWLDTSSQQAIAPAKAAPVYNNNVQENARYYGDNDTASLEEKVESVVSALESGSIDITSQYDEWVNIGFALANDLGETGRQYFHRLSFMYPGYSKEEANRKYDNFLSSQNHGITIATLFYYAQQHGISCGCETARTPETGCADPVSPDSPLHTNGKMVKPVKPVKWIKREEDLPAFDEEVFSSLPFILKNLIDEVPVDVRDTVLMGSMTCFSACLHNVRGIYNGSTVWPNLYFFNVAEAGMGKGTLSHCQRLVALLHQRLINMNAAESAEYKKKMNEYAKNKKHTNMLPPDPPKRRMLIIPADSTAASFQEIFSDSNGVGLIFETEADTLTQAFNSKHGHYSHVMRAAYQHEPVTVSRKTDNLYIQIPSPCLSVVLSGTPEQVRRLIPSAEDGLMSRFLFYYTPFKEDFRDVFAVTRLALSTDKVFDRHGDFFCRQYEKFAERGEYTFILPEEYHEDFNSHMRAANHELVTGVSKRMQAVLRRMGLARFRIMMILAAVREMDTGESYKASPASGGPIPLLLDERDYIAAEKICDTLLYHAVFVDRKAGAAGLKAFNSAMSVSGITARRKALYDYLPDCFSKKEWDAAVALLGENPNTALKWIDAFIRGGSLERVEQGKYRKI